MVRYAGPEQALEGEVRPLYRSDGIISGNVRIDTGGRRMWVGSMEVRLEE